jgi:flagellar basal body rod protein FlgF
MHFTSAFGNIDMMAAKNATRTALFVTDLATTASRAADNSIVDIAETTAHRAAGQNIEDYTPNGQYNLQANQVTITVGGVGITVTSTGPIAISSSGAVTINAAGPVNVTSAGPVTIQGNPVAIN